jgi:hypothetical protein
MTAKPKRATGALAGIRVARVEWLDAMATADWIDWHEARGPHRCVSIGAIVADDATSITLAGSWGLDTDGVLYSNNCMTIPAGMILKRRFVRA